MIRIIKNTKEEPIKCECGECKSLFEYNYEDIRRETHDPLFPINMPMVKRYVICPVCKADCIVSFKTEGEEE
jgi:hypothetical protein